MLPLFRSFFGMIRTLFQTRKFEKRLWDELQLHIDLLAEKNISLGMSHEEAQRCARLAVGGFDQARENVHDARGIRWLSELQRNFRYSFRRLVKSPLLSLAVLLSLGLGIGANTAIFSMMHQILLRPLPVEKPEELAFVTAPGASAVKYANWHTSTGTEGNCDYIFSYPSFRQLEKRNLNAVELAGFKYISASISDGNDAVSGSVLMVSGGYFPLMRVRPVVGRTLIPSDDQSAGSPVAMLAYDYWKNKLGGRKDILAKPIRISGQVFSIVGVAPRGFFGTTIMIRPDVFIPLATMTSLSKISQKWVGPNSQNDYWIYLVARIKPGVTREKAEASYSGVYARIVEEEIEASKSGKYGHPNLQELKHFRESRMRFIDGSRGNRVDSQDFSAALSILLVITGLVLLIAMANAANLLLARSAARRRELGICAAIGASRGKIVGQLLSEALVLSVAGGVASFPISSIVLHHLNRQIAQAGASPDLLIVQLEWPVLLYGFSLSLLTGLVFGLYPALEAAKVAPVKALNQESGHVSEAFGAARVRKILVCAQVMLSAMLLIPTGLLLKSLVKLMKVDLGLRTENLITFGLSPSANGYTSTQSWALYERVEQELAKIPGMSGVTSAACPLINNLNYTTSFAVEGDKGKMHRESSYNAIAPGFFGMMGIPLMRGREFTESDNASGQKVAIVNEQFAKVFFAGQNPIGRKINLGGRSTAPVHIETISDPIEIVGVAKNSQFLGVDQKPTTIFYMPCRQYKEIGSMTYYVRSALPLSQAIVQVRKALRMLDANLPLDNLWTMEDQVKRNTFVARGIAQNVGTSAALATALAMMGLYGVMAYSVIRRTREIGIRLAIGAKPAGIRKMVLREMLRILVIGLALGIPVGLAASKVGESLLFGVKAYDPFVLICAVLALGLAAFAAAFLPAWRASRIDPLNTLRCD
jgi:putative ABC transport system permease protein